MTENDYMIKDLGEEELLELAELFKMFADSTRIKILYDLFDGEKNVSEICEDIEMNQSAVSHQLKALKTGKLIKSRREGKAIYYSLDDDHVKTIIEMGKEHEVVNGKWQPFEANLIIVLRRVQNPTALKIGNGNFVLTKQLNYWLGFDIQKHDFVRPHGTGEVTDFEVKIDWNGKWYPDYTGMGIELRFSTPYSGFYKLPVNPASKFKGPYSADAEKAFCQKAAFDEQVVNPTQRIRHPFDENKCWVVRSRCKVDEMGKLISANYSVIYKISFCGKYDGKGGVRITGFFNPTPNDTNLEPGGK